MVDNAVGMAEQGDSRAHLSPPSFALHIVVVNQIGDDLVLLVGVIRILMSIPGGPRAGYAVAVYAIDQCGRNRIGPGVGDQILLRWICDVVCLVLIVSSLLQWQQPTAVYLLIASSLYLIGCFGVTVAFNVPLNDTLAVANPDSTEGVTLWAKYLTSWTFWNHVRAIAAFVAAALFVLSSTTPAQL